MILIPDPTGLYCIHVRVCLSEYKLLQELHLHQLKYFILRTTFTQL